MINGPLTTDGSIQQKDHRPSTMVHGLFVVLGASAFLLSACENSEKAIQEWTNDKVLVEEAKDITTHFSQGGKARATLRAPLMLRKQTDTILVEFPKTLHVDFYDSLGNKESQLDARYGLYYESQNKVFLRDSVVVATVKGDTLRTPELWWDQNRGKFFTDKLVRIRQADKQIFGGRGFEADQDLSSYTIFQNTGVVAPPPGM